MRLRHGTIGLAFVAAFLHSAPGQAEPVEDYSTGKALDVSNAKSAKSVVEQIHVTASRHVGHLDQHQGTGSRLGLTVRETPATIVVIGAQTIQARGYNQVESAIDSTPGTNSGGSPGDPTGFSMRGFTGDQITILRNGVYEGPSDMVNRPQNSFNLTDIEVLKGPASVLYGQGAVGGVINIIPKQPVFGPASADALFSYGSFNTINAGVGMGAQLSDRLAMRIDLSRTSSSGYVHNDKPESLNLTAAVLWRILDNLQLEVSFDAMHDDLPSYYGTPLIPTRFASDPMGGLLSSTQGLSVERPTRYNNYNVTDATHTSSSYLPTATLSWEPSDNIVVTNES